MLRKCVAFTLLRIFETLTGCPQGQGILEVREKSGKSILVREVREKSGNLEFFGKSQGKLRFWQILKNGQIFCGLVNVNKSAALNEKNAEEEETD